MSFDAEWQQLVAAASEQKTATRMQLNRLDGGGGSGRGADSSYGELTVSQKDLAAIGDAAFKLRERLIRDGDHARSSSYAAATALKKDFAIGGALDYVTTRWREQLRTLTDACGHISNHLEYTNKAHTDNEQHIGGLFNSLTKLEQGFDGGKQR